MPFDSTPVTDGCRTNYATGPLSLARCLYASTASNLDPGAAHATAALTHIAAIQKLDVTGAPSVNGLIGVATIGLSLMTDFQCAVSYINTLSPTCLTNSFQALAIAGQSGVPTVNPNLTFANLAQYGQGMDLWALPRNSTCDSGTSGNANCTSPWDTAIGNGIAGGTTNRLAQYGLVANQVQVVILLAVEEPMGRLPLANLGHAWPCVNTDTGIEACFNEINAGNVMRLIKTYFPKIQVVYLADANYGGFEIANPSDPTHGVNPDVTFNGTNYAYSYEYAFTNQHLESCQEAEADGAGSACSATGSLAYSVAPLILRGPYLWTRDCAFGTDAEGQCVNGILTDYIASDGRHPCALTGPTSCSNATATTGSGRIARMMMGFFNGTGSYGGTAYTFNSTGTYTRWFLP